MIVPINIIPIETKLINSLSLIINGKITPNNIISKPDPNKTKPLM